MKHAAAFSRNGRYIVHAWAQTTDGVSILWKPILAISEDEGAEALGLGVIAALDGSRTGVPHPVEWKGLAKPLLAVAGVRSWVAFVKSTTHIDVAEENGRILLAPTRNLGAKGGFEPDPDPSHRVFTTRDDPARLGALTADVLRAAT